MTIRRPFLVVTALCVSLALATSASAECAWVLWGNDIVEGNKIETIKWEPIQGFVDAQACQMALRERMQSPDNKGRFAYRCLPDTVDLRAEGEVSMGVLALALFIGLLAIALAILRVAHVLDAIRLQSIVIANEAIQSYDAAHKLIRSAVSPPQKEVEFESKTPRSRWTPPEVK